MSDRLVTTTIICALITLNIFVFLPIKDHQFLNYDDNLHVTENVPIRTGLTKQGLVWSFTNFGHTGNWHPLTWLSHMLDVELFGMEAGWHHLTSLALHIVNTLLLFLIMKAMIMNLWPSTLVAVLFAVHPLHVESVAWVSERKDVLSTMFWFAAMAAYLYYAKKPNLNRYLWVAVFLVLGLMAKPMLVTLPLIFLLIDWWPLGRLTGRTEDGRFHRASPGKLIIEKLPFFALSLVSSGITYIAQTQGGAVRSLENYPLSIRVINALVSYVVYIRRTILPTGLAILYPHPGYGLTFIDFIGSFFFLAAVTLIVIWQRPRKPYLMMGWFWYLGTLVPVIGLVQVGSQAMADRYTYVPLIGIFIMAACAMFAGSKINLSRKFLVLLPVIIVLAFLARRQTGFWHDSSTVFNRALAVTSNNWLAHNNLGEFFYQKKKLPQAEKHFLEAVRIQPGYPSAHMNLGNVYSDQGRFEQAMTQYRQAIALDPSLCASWYNLGTLYFKFGDLKKAEQSYRRALELRPDNPDTHNNLATVLMRLGHKNEAIAQYSAALALAPNFKEAHFNLGIILLGEGRTDPAIEHFRQALQIDSGYTKARMVLDQAIKTQLDRN